MLLRLKIFRFDPEKDHDPHYRTYEVEADPADRLLDCLMRIRGEQDATLSFRKSCGQGTCGSDGMRINGVCGLACQRLVRNLRGEVLVEPLPVFRVVKDLVVDLGPFFETVRFLEPYLITQTPAPDRERVQLPEEHGQIGEAIRCILCACCTASCPVNQEKGTGFFVGPAALLRAFQSLFDSRDEGSEERMRLLEQENGVWGCRTQWQCTEVCPREIPVTREISQIKKKIYESKLH